MVPGQIRCGERRRVHGQQFVAKYAYIYYFKCLIKIDLSHNHVKCGLEMLLEI